MFGYIDELVSSDLQYELLKELAENETVSYEKMYQKFGREILDNLETRNFIIRIFVKRGYKIWSFYKLSVVGNEIFFIVKGIRGERNGRE